MLKRIALLVSIAHAQIVDLNSYLPFATPLAASQRSKQMCAAVHCTGITRCWWGVVQLSDGTGALRIGPSGIYGQSAAGVAACAVGCGLTASEISSLVSAGSLGSKLTNGTDLDCP